MNMEPGPDTPRWRAVVWYRSDNGPIECEHFIEELEDLQDLVERGPGFHTIDKIEIFYQLADPDDMVTIEEDARR
jgi:hypothetical protein